MAEKSAFQEKLSVRSDLRVSNDIIKITDRTTMKLLKYVFIGTVPTAIQPLLDKLSKSGVSGINEEEYFVMTDHFGVDWEFSLGIYRFHLYSGLSTKRNFVADAKSGLNKAGLKSYNSFKKAKRINETIINCARRIWPEDILQSVASYQSERVKFIFDYPIRLNDDIKTVKQKISVQFNHLAFTAIPEWQHLWHSNNVSMGCDIIDRLNHETRIMMPSNPVHEYLSFLNRQRSEFTEKLQNKTYRIQKTSDTILHDYAPFPKNEINVCILPSFLFRISNTINRLPLTLQNPSEFFRLFLKRFFPDADKSNILNIISSTSKPYDVIKESHTFIDKDLKQQLNDAEDSLRLLEDCQRTPTISSHLQSINSQVQSNFVGQQLDLEKIFLHLHVDELVVFISTKTGRKSTDAFFSRFKLKKDIHLWQHLGSDIKSWLHPTDESRKAKTLTLRFRLYNADSAQVTFVLHENGDYKIHANWPVDKNADLSSFVSILKLLKPYIQKLQSYDFKIDNQIQDIIKEPSFCLNSDFSCFGNMQVKNMTHRFVFKCSKTFRYESFRQVAACAFTYLALADDQVDINKFWKRTSRFSSVVSKLEQLGLYNVSALVDLSNSKKWNKLELVPNTKANASLIDDFRRYIDGLTANRISFYFKKHSRYESLTLQRQVVNDFLRSQKISFQDALDNSELYTALFIELRRKMQISNKDTLEFLAEFKDSFADEEAGQASVHIASGIRCDVGMNSSSSYKVTVSGIRSFTPRSSVAFLLRDICYCFSKLFCLYQHPNLKSILQRHHHLWQNAKLSEHSLDMKESLSPKDVEDEFDDTFDFVNLSFSDTTETKQSGIPSRHELISERYTVANQIDSNGDDALADNSEKGTSEPAFLKKSTASKGSYHLSRLQARDPYLFKPNTKLKRSFATKCQKNFFVQPVILTPEEFARQDKSTFKTPKGTPDGFKYRNHYYICPEIWCPKSEKAYHASVLSNQVWSNSDLNWRGEPVPKIIAGTCPDGEKAIISNDGIGGWKAKNISEKDPSQGRKEYPGFLTGLHPDGIGVPCCFQNDRSIGPSAPKFFALLAGQSVNKTNTAESSRRYRLKASKFPLQDGRFGDLIPDLDFFFNKSPPEDPDQSKIYHEGYSRFLRLGVDQTRGSSFLSCIAAIYNMHSKQGKSLERPLYIDAFKAFLSDKLTDVLLFDSLKNGNLKLIFKDFSTDDALAKFRQYLEINPEIDKDYVWDLVSRPLEWLFKTGLNIFIFHQDETSRISLDLPTGECIPEFYKSNSPSIFLFSDGTFFEPIVHVDNQLKTSALFSAEDSYVRVRDLIPEKFNQIQSPFQALNILNKFKRLKNSTYHPCKQYINDYNKIMFFELNNQTLVPVDCYHGPFWSPVDSKDRIPAVYSLKDFSAGKIIHSLPFISETLQSDVYVKSLIPNKTGKPVAILLNTGHVLPTSDAHAFIKRHKISTSLIFSGDKDSKIFKGEVISDDRIVQVDHYLFLKNSLDRLRNELAEFVHRDLYHDAKKKDEGVADVKSTASRSRSHKIWFSIYNIINGVDVHDNPLDLSAKTHLLFDLFLRPKTGLLHHIVETKKETRMSETGIKDDSICSQPIGLSPFSCNRRKHCSFNRKCKLYIPRDYLHTFTSLLIDDLLRNNVGLDQVMQHRIQSLARIEKIQVTADEIAFDDDLVPYILYMLDNFDLLKLRQLSLPNSMSPSPAAEEPLRKLKEHIIYNGLIDPVIHQIEQAYQSVQPLPGPWSSSLPDAGYLAVEALDVFAYLISCISNNLNHGTAQAYTSSQFRQDIVSMLITQKSHADDNSAGLLWKHYLSLAKSSDKSINTLMTLKQLCKSLVSDSWRANLGDILMLSKLYPFHVVILNQRISKKIGRAEGEHTHTLIVFVDAHGKISIVASKLRPPPSCFFFDNK